jgi:DNA-binding NarL/FixJ family response regulator
VTTMVAPSEDVQWQPGADDLTLLAGLAEGETVESVARRAGLSERTVRRRLRAMADEAGVGTTMELVVRAVRRELI